MKKSAVRRWIGTAALVAFALYASAAGGAEAAIKLIDVAAKAGVTLLNICGDASKDFIVDANGSGAAWVDYDNDGALDLLIVNGSTREQMKLDGDPMLAIYRNDGAGHFDDVTVRSGAC